MLEILGFGKAVPEKVVTNFDFEKTLETSDEWIVTRTGIRERHFANGESNASLSSKAAKNCIETNNINKEKIKVLIVATFTPDFHTPSVSTMVAGNLGLNEDIICFDLNAACAGFMYALNTAASLLKGDEIALVVGGEIISTHVDMTDKTTCVLFGDAAAAAALKLNSEKQFAFISGTRPNQEVLYCNMDNRIIMHGQEVYKFATEIGKVSINRLLEENNLTKDDIKCIVCHQANIRIIETISKRTKIEMDKFYVNIHKYGNTSAASIPLALSEIWHTFSPGDKIICVGFGAGLVYGGILITV